jgi:diguanylate cyclase (GGDEF)-like protein
MDALVAHRERIMYRVAIVGAICLLPFAVNNFLDGRHAIGAAVMAVVLTLGIDALAIHLEKRPPIPFALLLVPMAAGMLLSVRAQGIYGALWSYPLVLFCYFVLPPRPADAASVVLLGVTTWMVERYIGQGVAIRFFASLTLTIVVVNIIRTIIRELQARLLDLAITDPLTGAFNRRHMASCLGDAVERHRRTGAPASVLLIDVDHFKRINDRLGHEAGDGVLKGIVALVTRRARRLDRLFRMGGDEFVLFLPDTRGLDAATVAEELRGSVVGARLLNAAPVSVSIGVSELQANESADAWVKQADDALYRAKNDGRNRVACRDAAAPQRAGRTP